MTVEMDVFSGRPNPTWELAPEHEQELQRRVSALRQHSARTQVFDGLGYRGLIVRDPRHPEAFLKLGFGQLVRVENAMESVYLDEGRVLEQWLLSTAKGKIDDRLIAAVGLRLNRK